MNDLLKRYPCLSEIKEEIIKAKEIIISCYENEGKLLLCGNGGSSADCDHIVGELMKGFLKERCLSDEKKAQMKKNAPFLEDEILSKLQCGLPAISLPSMTALNTAFSNDIEPELVYAQSLMSLGNENDVLVAISTSGNSKNVSAAAKVAKALGCKVIALTGASGGKLKELSDVCLCVPEEETFKVQELHLPIYHYLCAQTEAHFFK
ncbi:MAG: SIS domain-containing protein [Clostridia bacterium]|nr:SIS domain-containing protein [Clostridia bacterium]